MTRWVSDGYAGGVRIAVVRVAEDAGTAGALRAALPLLGPRDTTLVVAGDLLCCAPLSALLAKHRGSGAAATVLLAPRRPGLAPERKAGRPPPGVDYIGLDASGSRLCFASCSEDAGETLRLPRAAASAAAPLTVHTELADCGAYALHATALAALAARPNFTSLRRALLPHLVRRQFSASTAPAAFAADGDADGGGGGGGGAGDGGSGAGDATDPRLVAVYILPPTVFAMRVDSLKAYAEANRELASPGGEGAARLHGLPLHTTHDNYVSRDCEIGAKSAVGPGCVVGPGVRLAEKVSIKRSVIGSRCRLGAGARVTSTVVHEDVAIGEGAQLSGCVVGARASVGAGAALRDCTVAPGAVVAPGAEMRTASLAGR